jgi:cytochrome c peroxidase
LVILHDTILKKIKHILIPLNLLSLFIIVTIVMYACENESNKKESILPLGQVIFDSLNPEDKRVTEFGKQLFFDVRLSVDNSVSCATCHLPERAFTDGRVKAEGILGRTTMRNAPTLLNIGYQPHFMFDGAVPTLEMQALVPLKDTNEMGNDIQQLVDKLRAIPEYQALALELYGRDFDAFVLTRALGNFQRSLISQHSPFDQWYYNKDTTHFNSSAERGYRIFSEKLYCTSCHTPPAFTTYEILNNGIDTLNIDEGLFRITGNSVDIGKFKVPTLRNISLTAPYMHDGSIENLYDVVQYYSKGGHNHQNQDLRIKPFELNAEEVEDLIHFFEALTDTSYMNLYRGLPR